MSNFRSIVERAVHTQLQHLTRFQIPIPLYTALVFSNLPIVGRTSSSTSVSALATTLWKALTKLCTSESIPLLTPLFNIFTCALNTACLRMRIHIQLPHKWRQIFHRPRGDDTYATPRAEAKYWRVAGRYRRRLYSGNGAAFAPSPSSTTSGDGDGGNAVIPLVTYYTPRLLPLYRDRASGEKRTSREADADAQECPISPKTFCKWHRMVFQDSPHHPTLAQAAVQIKYYSTRDLREIQRIARLLPDEHVFDPKWRGARKAKGSTKYRVMWQKWLENKAMDLVIVFE